MRLDLGDAVVISADELDRLYWEPDIYPAWCALNVFRLVPDRVQPWGPEPHYHDVDEYWLFVYGYGQVGLGATRYEVGANAVAFTPAGVVHRFHMWTPSRVVAAITRLVSGQRAGHLLAFDPSPGSAPHKLLQPPLPDGYLVGTDPVNAAEQGEAFVISGPDNSAVAALPGSGALAELRCIERDDFRSLQDGWVAEATQLLLVVSGSACFKFERAAIRVGIGDEILLRRGATMRVVEENDAVIARATQRNG
jgi:mannose-6-phosphate isomerase-like protein (cupin superfamily)